MSDHGTYMQRDGWEVSGLRDAAAFFRAVPVLLPDATHVLLEGSPAPGVREIVAKHAEPTEYLAPRGTLWSWPQKNQRFVLKASPALFAALADAATCHAQPEICDHLHFYRGEEPLAQWFDAFIDPLVISKSVSRDRLQEFSRATGGDIRPSSG